MLIERTIIFVILGFFFFSPQIPSWQESEHVANWYGYYLPGVISLLALGWALRPGGKPPN
jgi:hypothetical protein